ncbi:MAG: acyltransferase, partial [Bacillota bacterium]|nr:acyltransferase [Bacillota bacterium]
YVYMGTSSLGRWGWISLAIVAVSYIIATLSYYLVEKPILDKAHKISGRRKNSAQSSSQGA